MTSTPTPSDGFGCRVVPSQAKVLAADEYLRAQVALQYPGKNSQVEQLIEHHNLFTKLVGFRMSLLLALRERSQYSIVASIDETRDMWITIEDKSVPGMKGEMPVPMCPFAKESLRAYRVHVATLRRRLRAKHLHLTQLASWCGEVTQYQNTHLLKVAHGFHKTRALGTSDWLDALPPNLKIPPDFGRKILENALRVKGLHSSEIDAVLRHTVQGQSKLLSTNEDSLLCWVERASKMINLVAQEYFDNIVVGLAKV